MAVDPVESAAAFLRSNGWQVDAVEVGYFLRGPNDEASGELPVASFYVREIASIGGWKDSEGSAGSQTVERAATFPVERSGVSDDGD